MKTLERILAVLTKNLGLTIVLVLAVILFAIFADGLIGGIITAISALLAYTCVEMLYQEYKKTSAPAATKVKPSRKKRK